MKADQEYRPTPREYLRRAKQRLADANPEAMFYAALEIRCSVEARLQEYLDPQQHVTPREKNQWNAGKLASSVTRAFKVDKVARVIIKELATGNLLGTYYYTPVSRELRKLSDRLGNYLHAMRGFKPPGDEWWTTFESELRRGIELLEETMSGSLLGPPIRKGGTNQVTMPLEPLPDQPDPRAWPGVEVLIDVAYFDTLADARVNAA